MHPTWRRQVHRGRLDTFGGYGVIELPQFQKLLHFICENGYEHHVAATKAEVAESIDDA